MPPTRAKLLHSPMPRFLKTDQNLLQVPVIMKYESNQYEMRYGCVSVSVFVICYLATKTFRVHL